MRATKVCLLLLIGGAGCGIPAASDVTVDGRGVTATEAGSVNGGRSEPPSAQRVPAPTNATTASYRMFNPTSSAAGRESAQATSAWPTIENSVLYENIVERWL